MLPCNGAAQLAVLRQLVERRRQALANLEAQLTELLHGASAIPAWIVRSAQATQRLVLGRSCGTQLSLSPAGARRRTRRHRGGGLLGSIESLRQCSDGAVRPILRTSVPRFHAKCAIIAVGYEVTAS